MPNTITEVYLKRNLDDHMEGTGRVTRWLASEMEGLKQQATDAQAGLARYQKEHNLIDAGPVGGTTDSLELDRLRLNNGQVAGAQANRIVSEAKLGRGAPWAAPLSWLVPPRVAMQLLVTGDPITAERAREVGLVNEVAKRPLPAWTECRHAQQPAHGRQIGTRQIQQRVG